MKQNNIDSRPISGRRVGSDTVYMLQAIRLAQRGQGLTMPNPPVGAVIVLRGKIVGRGYHRRAGAPHAEIEALRSAGNLAHDAGLFVTLEPCCTQGRTGPCTDAIIQSGIKRVVVAVRDPNPKHNGRGIRILKNAGIDVTEGVCSLEAASLLKPFTKWITTKKPFLTLKLGVSLDGKIADNKGKSRWITSESSRADVKKLRGRVDAILIGSGTAVSDNPSLLGGRAKQPFRVIVDSRGTLPPSAKVLNDGYVDRTIIATTERCPDRKKKQYAGKGAQVWMLPVDHGHVALRALLNRMGHDGILHVLCEGGVEIAFDLIKHGLVDEYLFYVAPIIIGGKNSTPSVAGKGWPLDSCPRLKFIESGKLGNDLLVRAVPLKI